MHGRETQIARGAQGMHLRNRSCVYEDRDLLGGATDRAH